MAHTERFIAGSPLGPGIGAHLLNDRRSDPWMTMTGRLLGAAVEIGLGYLAGDAAGSPGWVSSSASRS